MKKFVLLIAIAIMTCTSFSQTLTPTLISYDKDTLQCFNKPQSEIIAKLLIKGHAVDSIRKIQVFTMSYQDSVIIAQKGQNNVLRAIIDNDNVQIANLNQIQTTLKKDIKIVEKEVKVQKRQKWMIAIGSSIIVALSLIHR